MIKLLGMKDQLNAINKPIALIGMMGTGKSLFGARLAKKLGWNFYDSDPLIEERAGRSIPDIFEEFGETKFREAERNVILELLDKNKCVISTGGGAVTNEEVLSGLKDKSLMIWLKSDPEDIYKRVRNSENRPLLMNDDPLAVLKTLSEEREGLYAQAHMSVEVVPGQPNETLENVIKTLSDFVKTDTV